MTTHNNRPLTKRIEERSEELTPLGRQMVDYLMRNPNDLLRLAKLVRLQNRDLIVIADSRNCPLFQFTDHYLSVPCQHFPIVGSPSALSCVADRDEPASQELAIVSAGLAKGKWPKNSTTVPSDA